LLAEDVVTAFGAPSARRELLESLRQPSPTGASDPVPDVLDALEHP
jgi:hypothetical protein